MGSVSDADAALTSLKDFHAQYNRLEGVTKFTMAKISTKLLRNAGRGQNEKLDEIYNKLRDPNGNAERLRRNAIVNNKHRSAALWHAPSALNNVSLSNMSEGLPHAFGLGALQSTRHRRHNTSFFSSLDESSEAVQLPGQDVALPPFRTLSTARMSDGASGAALGQTGHPIEAKLAELRE